MRINHTVRHKNWSSLVIQAGVFAIVDSFMRVPVVLSPSQSPFFFVTVVAELKPPKRTVLGKPHDKIFTLGPEPLAATPISLSNVCELGEH